MALGLVGRKVGMTKIFDDNGNALPITVLEVIANRVTQIKKVEKEGYNAIQLTYGEKKVNRLNKAQIGHFSKSGVEAGKGLIEFKLDDIDSFKLGQKIDLSIFKDINHVDVTAISKGKGFAGNIKRHNFSSQRASHGNSISHRVPGSIGQCQDPGRVFKGKRMPGHLGSKRVTSKNLKVARIDLDRQLILIVGSVPGAKNSEVTIRPSFKNEVLA